MNALYAINYLIFSIFFTLFMVEVGITIITMLNYNKYKGKINHIINPIWEVTGTFAVLYIINFEASYPGLVSVVGNAYVMPLLIAAILIIMRNIFIAFSEYIGNEQSERRFRLVYSISTIIAAALAIAVLTSGISGIGISLAANTIGSAFLINPFNILILVSILLFSLSLANGLIVTDELQKISLFSTLGGFIISFAAVYLYLPNFASALQSNILLIIIGVILTVTSAFLQLKKMRYSGLFNIMFIILLINIFGASTYPYIFGTLNLTNYMPVSALANAEILISTVGGIIVALSLLGLIYANYLKK